MKKKISLALSILLFITAVINFSLLSNGKSATLFIIIYWLLNSIKLGLDIKKWAGLMPALFFFDFLLKL